MATKRCTICGKIKPVGDFVYSRTRQKYLSRCRECDRAKQKEWRKKNKQKHLDRNREWRANNPDKVHEQYARQWQKRRASIEYQASMAAWRANKRAEHFGLSGRITKQDILDLWERQPLCQECGSSALGVDHKKPMVSGGENVPDNLQHLCFECNRKKNVNE